MKTVFTYGGPNPYLLNKDELIELRQSDDKNARFILTYGTEVKPGLNYADACTHLGAALLHHLSCEGIINNEGV